MKNDIDLKKNNNINAFQLLNNIKIECFSDSLLDNSFCAFKSLNNIFYLIYSYKFKTIIFYNLVNNTIIGQIKKAHKNFIITIKHYLDNNNKRDLIISISLEDHNIKVWNIYNIECILDISPYIYGGFSSACLLNDKNNNYIITCNNRYQVKTEPNDFKISPDFIKIYNFDGKLINLINNSLENAFFIDTFYDNKFSKNYIITGNISYIKSYDYDNNISHNIYCDNDIGNKELFHYSIVVSNYKEIIKIIGSCQDGYVRIWDFHSAQLLNKIKVSDYCLYGIYLWNNKYLYVGCQDSLIKIIDINKGEVINYLIGHNNAVICIKKIIHPKYGEYLISRGFFNDGIKFWKKINN